jgi:hypothetical protein
MFQFSSLNLFPYAINLIRISIVKITPNV